MSVFLSTVLPSTGLYCVAGFVGKARRHYFKPSIDELQTAIDAAALAGADVYFALASFASESRTAEQATHLRSLFVDLDCGEGKPYESQDAAAVALRAFVDQFRFPRPTYIVSSGGGLHVYWALERDLPVSEWLPLARRFKTFCLTNGLKIDPAVTADAARILRVPGTNNLKTGTPRPVSIIFQGKPTTVAAVEAVLPPPEVDLSAARAYGVDATTSDLAKSTLDPCNFRRIVIKSVRGDGGCGQIRHAVEEAATLEEPLWRAALSIAWNCEDGPKAIHTLSRPHPEYDAEATIAKAQRLDGKPYTCEWYRSNYPQYCEGCTHKIGSPIVLGRFVPEAEANADGSYTIEARVDSASPMPNEVPAVIPELPYGYFRGVNGGIYKRTAGPDGAPMELEIYPHDLYVEERFYDTLEGGDGEGELVTICLNLPRDGLRRFVVPLASLMSTDTLRTQLSKHGLVAFGKQVNLIMSYLAAAIHKLQSTTISHRTRSQMGWTPERHFVVGNVEYTPHGPKLAPPASTVRHLAPWFEQKGSLDVWRDIISTYNTPGMEPLGFAFLVGAGSPLLQLLDAPQVKGGVLHLVSNESGSGKTSAQLAINSLFGDPSRMLLGEKDTANAKVQTMGMFNSIAVTIDEITAMEPAEISDLVYGATEGRGKHRMESQANRLRVNHATWCLFTITSGNAVISDALLANKTAAEGELKRLVELRAHKLDSDVPREAVLKFNELGRNYGLAGPIYIQYVVNNYDAVAQALKAVHERIVQAHGFDRSDRFYTAQLACASMAGKLLKDLGLIDLDVRRILQYGLDAIKGAKDTAETSTGAPATMALETLTKFITDNYSNTLVIKSDGSGEAAITQPKGALRIRYEPDTKELVILAADLRNYFVSRRVDFRHSIKEFLRMGALKTKDGSPTINRRLSAGAQNSSLRGAPARCYVFDAEVLGMQTLPGAGDAAQGD